MCVLTGQSSCLSGLLLLCLTVSSCNFNSSEKTYTIGFSQRTNADTWRRTMLENMNRELSFDPDIQFIVKDANGQSARQVRQIQELIDQRIDLLIVSPNAAQPITPIVEKAYQQGIPVVILDRRTASDQYTAYVGADNVEVGRTAGRCARAVLRGQGNMIEIGESPGSSADIDRHEGFMQAIQASPGLRLIKKLQGDWDRQSFAPELSQLLQTQPAIDLIFAQNDRTALKAYRVCEKLGLINRVKIIGIDGLSGPNEGIDLVDRGMLSATVLYPTGGKEAIRTAVAILKKQPFKRENRLPITLIDSSNVDLMKLQGDKLTEQQVDITRQQQRIDQLNQTYSSQENTLYLTLVSLLVALMLGGYALYLYRSKQTAYQTLEHQNEEIRTQKDKIETVSAQARLATEEKLRFYSYISHEFNTPLSLILTPTEDLLSQRTVQPSVLQSNLLLVQKNAYRLLRLIDQMLDLRKTDAGKQRLHATEQDLVEFVRDIVLDFRPKAEKQRIDLQFFPERPRIDLWFDAEKLDKVIVNLLANAFKYTPHSGLIHVRIAETEGKAILSVADNGEGMTPDEQQRAFDLFFSGEKAFNLSKGLGLALSMEFVQLHQGDIRVMSEKGRGTTFVIQLPLGKAHLSPEEMMARPARTHDNALTQAQQSLLVDNVLPAQIPQSENQQRAGSLLIIEDNDDLRTFLAGQLGQAFDVIAESTAEAGWQQALAIIPDLIISDIMLSGAESPEHMDGLEFTQRVKADLRTSHIPVILLTAKGQMESRIEGTRAGADAYLTKPFNSAYLLETIRTMLANRERWQRRYASDFLTNGQSGNRADRQFLNELTALIEQNLTDSTFSVERLSHDMGISRVQLYRKVQALLNMNVSDYIADVRLRKAKRILIDTTKTMAEIAEETGFNSAAYFATFFRQHTGKTPSEFRKTPDLTRAA